MPATKAYSSIFAAATNVPAATTAGAPIAGTSVNTSAGYGGELIYRITNSGALGAPCVIMFETSPEGTNWFDYHAVASKDLLTGTVTEGSISLSRGSMFVRAIAYGNTTSACTVEAGIQQVTAL